MKTKIFPDFMPILRCLASSHLLKHILSISRFRNERRCSHGDVRILSCKESSLQRFQQTSFLQEYIRKPTAVNRDPATDIQGPQCGWRPVFYLLWRLGEFGKQELVWTVNQKSNHILAVLKQYERETFYQLYWNKIHFGLLPEEFILLFFKICNWIT